MGAKRRPKNKNKGGKPNPVASKAAATRSQPATTSPPVAHTESIWRRHSKLLTAGIALSITLLGAASALVTFLPRVSIDPAGQMNVDAWQIPFTITNSGNIPLTDVEPGIGVCLIVPNGGHPPPDGRYACGAALKPIQWRTPRLGINEKWAIHFSDQISFPNGVALADIFVRVDYYPWFLRAGLFRQKTEQRFQARTEANGALSWTPVPISAHDGQEADARN